MASLSITHSQSLLKLMSIESVMPSNHLILCCPLLLLPSIFPRIRVFSNESALHIRWPNYWSFISPSKEYSGLISFRIYWFGLLPVQGTLKSLLPHHSSKASCFFMVQHLHPYMTTGKTIALLCLLKRCTTWELRVKFYWGQNEDCSPWGSISDSSERLLQSSSGRKSIIKVLVKGEFNTMKRSFYEKFFVSHEDLMSPWRDLALL